MDLVGARSLFIFPHGRNVPQRRYGEALEPVQQQYEMPRTSVKGDAQLFVHGVFVGGFFLFPWTGHDRKVGFMRCATYTLAVLAMLHTAEYGAFEPELVTTRLSQEGFLLCLKTKTARGDVS